MRIYLLVFKCCVVVVAVIFLCSCAGVPPSQGKNPSTHDPGPDGEVMGAIAAALITGVLLGNVQDDSEPLKQKTPQTRLTFEEQLKKLRLGKVERNIRGFLVTFSGGSYFSQNSYELKSGGRKKLTKLADLLLQYPRTTFIVEAHTSTKGDDDFNQMLSEKQVVAFMTHLVRSGVREERIERLAGLGESRPIHKRDSQNWRIEMLIR